MPLVLSQRLHQVDYNDIVGEQYHFPRQYWSYVQCGERFIYYHPGEKEDPRQYYFGMGWIGAVGPDPVRQDHRYADLLEYVSFSTPVPFKADGECLEARPGVGTRFFSAVRPVSEEVWERIVSRAEADPLEKTECERVTDLNDVDGILADLNARYGDVAPRTYQQLVKRIERPTAVSRALKKKLGHTCQICGVEGFRKRSGHRYAEAHHLSELQKLEPGSLITENILIVCANCHRKLHYADVKVETILRDRLRITIGRKRFEVKRNV